MTIVLRAPFRKLLSLRKPPRCLRTRTPLYHPDFPLVLFWSEKAGCTLVVKWFFAQVGLLAQAQAYGRWIHRYELEVYKARSGYRHDLWAALRSGSHTGVKVVRDPWRRAVSAFLILAERGAVNGRNHWVKTHWNQVDAWLADRGEDPLRGISFMEHLTMVAAAEAGQSRPVNLHMSPQFVDGEERFVGQRVPIETFRKFCDSLPCEVARPVDWDALERSGHHHFTDEAVTEALGPQPEEAKITRGAFADGRFPDPQVFVNERSSPAIRAAYAADFNAYGELYRGG
ncbi:MAG: hypothetical protein AAGF45_04315 [Pseudomonadota bacterium]